MATVPKSSANTRFARGVLCLAAIAACRWQAFAGEALSFLPPYDFPYHNGLYGTIAGVLQVKDVDLKNARTLKLSIPTFAKPMSVTAVIQDRSAPLAVVLLGIGGKAGSDTGKLWPSWFSEAGCHVLTFDSTFAPSFIEVSKHGVTGNILAEASRIKDIMAAFLALPELRGKVSQVGIVGMSYGGLETLALAQMAQQGKLPFEVARYQAYCPPIRIQRTAEIIDRWFAEDRWQYTLTEMALELTAHKPVPSDDEIPFSNSFLRAGLSAILRLGLVDVVVKNDEVYSLKLLPPDKDYNNVYVRREYASAWGYTKFIRDMSFPYWKMALGYRNVDDLTGPVALRNLVSALPPTAEVIVAADDPLNDPQDLAELQATAATCPLTVLPNGGHVGFAGHRWTKAKLLSLFAGAPPAVAVYKVAPATERPAAAARTVASPVDFSSDTGSRRAAMAAYAAALRSGNAETIRQTLAAAARQAKQLFTMMDWPELVADIAAKSEPAIRELLLKYLQDAANLMTPESKARIAKALDQDVFDTAGGAVRDWLKAGPKGVDEATDTLKRFAAAKDSRALLAQLEAIGRAGNEKLLAAVAELLNSSEEATARAALAVFAKHAQRYNADVSSPKSCYLWWTMTGRQKITGE